jgi:beta-glucanase (GH16 family)
MTGKIRLFCVLKQKMTIISGLLTLLALISFPHFLNAQQTDINHKPGLKLVFFDDFNSPDLDKTRWMTKFSWSQCLPGSLAYFTPEGNYKIKNGNLYLTAKREMVNGLCGYAVKEGVVIPETKEYDYTSAVLTSHETFKYGYFECRFKVPRGTGFNSAFWLFGGENNEIDVFEITGSKPEQVQTTLHWKGKDPKNGSTQWFERTKIQPASDTAFHTMGVMWTADQLTWYLDGMPLKTRKQSQRVWKRHIPVAPLNLIVNLGVGIIDPAPLATTAFPADFIVDYIRAYSLESAEDLQIISQRSIKVQPGDSCTIDFKNLVVVNQTKLYPKGYSLNVLPGAYYHVHNGRLIPFKGFRGMLTVSVLIDDGIRKSNIFSLQVLVDDNTKTEKLSDPVIEIIYPPGNMELIVKYNSDPKGLVNFTKMEFLNDQEKLLGKFDPLVPGCIRITRNGLPAGLYYLKFSGDYNVVYLEKVEFK